MSYSTYLVGETPEFTQIKNLFTINDYFEEGVFEEIDLVNLIEHYNSKLSLVIRCLKAEKIIEQFTRDEAKEKLDDLGLQENIDYCPETLSIYTPDFIGNWNDKESLHHDLKQLREAIYVCAFVLEKLSFILPNENARAEIKLT